jgi:hypothetical protein
MQEDSAEELSVPQRLERFRVHTQATWEQVAKRIGLGIAMIYHVKRGARQLSTKALYRLKMAEQEAGLSPHPFFSPRQLKDHNTHLGTAEVGDPADTKARAEYLRKTAREWRDGAARTLAHAEELERIADEIERGGVLERPSRKTKRRKLT